MEEPNNEKSTTLIDEPTRPSPQNDKDEARRTKLRSEMVDPMGTNSIIDTDAPLQKLRIDTEEPRAALPKTESAELSRKQHLQDT